MMAFGDKHGPTPAELDTEPGFDEIADFVYIRTYIT